MNYLDTAKSVMISSPAGSGKTEKLARRYIALLQSGVAVERILAITFTEKASAEMKQRILRILKKEDKELFQRLLEMIPLMRVSTIHSFCGTLLRRFSFEAAIDPNYRIQDSVDSRMEWEAVLYEALMEAGKGSEGHALFLRAISEKGFRGLDYLKDAVDYLFQKNPFSLEADAFRFTPLVTDSLIEELKSWQGAKDVIEGYEELFASPSWLIDRGVEKYFLTDRHEPRKKPPAGIKGIQDYSEWALKMYAYWKDRRLEDFAERTERVLGIFRKCLDKYMSGKKTKSVLDFSDLEYLSYRMLTRNPEWANILYAFDERTDHILVDEFQDTNTFQWAIINKLTEEWRSGLGAKREEGIQPTIFLVGDGKQSIYFFRGANVELFHRAKEQMTAWIGNEFRYEEAKENFRSLPAIVDFTNHIFSRIMQGLPESPPWITRYSPFAAYRPGLPHSGLVEIILLQEDAENIREAKQREADILAKRIESLAGNFQVTDKNTRQQRSCRYSDIAVLLRKRTHLGKYEEAFRKHNIPFVAVKGIGFYQEPEIAMLRSLVFFLSNPRDDYSLYVLLKSPLFNIDESVILQLTDMEGDSLFEKIGNNPPLIPPLFKGGVRGVNEAFTLLRNWLVLIQYTPLSELIEHTLVSTKAWRYFHEAQRRANIKKFIRIVEDLEAKGKSTLKIRDFLERTYSREEEPKANVNTEGMDAVRIMTVHAAKGLEFPVVFVPGIEESFTQKTGDFLVFERQERFFFKSLSESSIRRQDEDFLIHQAKEEEEQKRLFYVAVTRAEEGLFLIGRWDERDRGFLGFLRKGLGMEKKEAAFSMEHDIQGLALLTEEDVTRLYKQVRKHEPVKPPLRHVEVIPLSTAKQAPWKAVTETVDIRRRHGKDWVVLGDVMHRIFEGISKGTFKEHDIRSRAGRMLEAKGLSKEQIEEKAALIEKEIKTMEERGIWKDIIMPRENSFAELPFVCEVGDIIYTGRIDRLIKGNGVYRIYDYKTFPVKENEIGYLLKEYAFQLNIYKKAVRELFNTKDVKSFIVFTHTGAICEV
jgi:ATP-dependent helicase/nuclease subunit A